MKCAKCAGAWLVDRDIVDIMSSLSRLRMISYFASGSSDMSRLIKYLIEEEDVEGRLLSNNGA